MTTPVPAILDRARTLVQPVLKTSVDTLVDELRTPARYQMGWIEADGAEVPGGGGKGIRPALAILSAEAVGAPGGVAADGGAAVELIHNFSLIHDDIIDGDVERRHRPTVWKIWGEGDAIIVGDALHALAFELMLNDASAPRVEATRRLVAGTSAMIAGQSADMSFENRDVVTFDDCLEMEANKTGALLAFSASVGAVMAGGPAESIEALTTFGAAIGLAFQAVDDVLGIWGDPAVTGKAVGNDLRERKRSMPVTAALHSGHDAAAEIAAMYGPGELDSDQIERLSGLIEQAGGRQRTEAEAQKQLEIALSALAAGSLEDSARSELEELAQFIVGRTH